MNLKELYQEIILDHGKNPRNLRKTENFNKDAIKKTPYERDPRGVAKKAEEYLKASGIGDKAFFGPEPEFFVFDDVRIKNDMNEAGFKIDSKEGPYNSGKEYENGNMGHRPGVKGGYFPVPPVDSEQDMRGEYLKSLKDVGIKVEKHHHEVAPSQHELGMYFGTLVDQADNVQLYKYVVQMVTHSFGKTATFMPKPVAGDNGSGMHIHQSIWKGDTPVFSGDAYSGLSETALHYIGGILKHAKAINAFANSTTNSYKRLIPGFEAPVLLAYSARNRSASCRIPITLSKKGARCEIRFPDAAGNPYLTFAAMLMAGLDGIKNKIHPGESFDKDLYELPAEEVNKIPTVCGSLREAMESLDKDREFLTQGGVFTDEKDVSMASPEDVKDNTGYTIGGVSPVGHLKKCDIYVDKSLERFSDIFGAAGHPNAVFKINYNDLLKMTKGQQKDIVE
jgi:glutamine synthetase